MGCWNMKWRGTVACAGLGGCPNVNVSTLGGLYPAGWRVDADPIGCF